MKIQPCRESYVQVNRLKLHCLEWGDKARQPLLLLHGLMGHAQVWAELASSLSRWYRVIALDQRGHGDSEWSQKGCYSLDNHFTDIYHFIESLGLDRLILLGHSMGGRNALFFTACIPEKVDRLILVDSRLGSTPVASKELRRQVACMPVHAVSIDEVSLKIRILYPRISMKLCRHMAEHGYKETDDGQYIAKYDSRITAQLEKYDYDIDNLWEMMGRILCPTLIIRGARSLFLMRKEYRRLRDVMPSVVCKEIPGATHMPAQENPAYFKKVLFDFLSPPLL